MTELLGHINLKRFKDRFETLIFEIEIKMEIEIILPSKKTSKNSFFKSDPLYFLNAHALYPPTLSDINLFVGGKCVHEGAEICANLYRSFQGIHRFSPFFGRGACKRHPFFPDA